MENVYPAAFGAKGMLYWSGNRIHGSHAPYYGAVIGWNGKPELEYPWIKEVGAFYKKWGKTLINNPVHASVAVFTDFEQRRALEVVPHIEGSRRITTDIFDIFHRMGIGADALNAQKILNLDVLKKYELLVLPTSSIMNMEIVQTITEYVRQGGNVIVSPLCDYLTQDALFQKQPNENLQQLTGVSLTSTRMFGGEGFKDYPIPTVKFNDNSTSQMMLDGLAEILVVDKTAKVLASFACEKSILNGYPAIIQNKIGDGQVIKLAYWPEDRTLSEVVNLVVSQKNRIISQMAAEGVHVVPRTDKRAFVVNTSFESKEIFLTRKFTDRISNAQIGGKYKLEPYQLMWIE